MIYLPTAIELAKLRTREAEQRAHEIDLIALATLAGRVAPYGDPEDPRHRREPSRPGRVRRIVARPVRVLSAATYAFAEAACSAASRIEGTAPSH